MKNNQRGFLAIGGIAKAVGGLLDLIPPLVWLGLVVACVLVNCGQHHMTALEHAKLVKEQGEHAETRKQFGEYIVKVERRESERHQFALQETEKQRELERFRNKAATETQNELIAETARTAAARAGNAERGRLLDADIAKFAAAGSGGGQASGDPAALARTQEAAATLGRLLATCRAEGASDAGELEDLASQVRGLIKSYDSLTPPATDVSPGG